MRKISLCLGFLAAAFLLVGSSTAMQGPIRLGALYNLTGDYSSYGISSIQGAALFVEQINGTGGLLDRPLEMIERDAQSDPQTAAAMAAELLAEAPDMPALFGLTDTDLVRTAAAVAAKDGRVFLTSGATSPILPEQVPTYLFLACFGDNVQAAAAAQFAHNRLEAKTAVIVYDSSITYTRLLQDYFSRSFEKLDGTIAATIPFKGAEGFATAVPRIPQADILYVAASSPADAFEFAKQLRESGFEQPILGGDGFDGEVFETREPALDEIYFTTHAFYSDNILSAPAQVFVEAYTARYGGQVPDAFAGLGYDAVGLLVEAMKRAGSTDPAQLLQALGTIEYYQGVTGTISFADGSRVPRKSVTIVTVAGGHRKFVTELTPDWVPSP